MLVQWNVIMYANITLSLALVSSKLNIPFFLNYFNGIKKLQLLSWCICEETAKIVSKCLDSVCSLVLLHKCWSNLPLQCQIFLIGNTHRSYWITYVIIRFMLWLFCLGPATTGWCGSKIHDIIIVQAYSGPRHSAPCVLSSFVSLVCKTDFSIFNRHQQILCHTIGDKTQQDAESWALTPALVVSDNSWWRYFFKLSDLIANSGQWYFQVCQGPSALRMPWKPFQLRVLALMSQKQPSCDKCLLFILLPRVYSFARWISQAWWR